MKRKIRVIHERTVYTHSELFDSANALLEQARAEEERHLVLYAMIGCAFSLEAYLNFLGEKLFKFWSQIERISVENKLSLFHQHFGLSIEYSARPYQTLKELFRFRNFMAHAKPEYECETKEYDEDHSIPREYPQMNWEKYCTLRHAERAFADVRQVINQLHVLSGVQDGDLGILGTSGQRIT